MLSDDEIKAVLDLIRTDLEFCAETLRSEHTTLEAAMDAYDRDAVVRAYRKLDQEGADEHRQEIKEALELAPQSHGDNE